LEKQSGWLWVVQGGGLEFPDLQDGGRLGPIPLASASWRHPVTSAAADRGFAQPTQKKKRPIEIYPPVPPISDL
jgi:hypothetical protein